MRIREAVPADAPAIARLVNLAYAVEHFFVAGDRTSPAVVADLMASGLFLVIDGADGALAACIFVAIQPPRAYFGMLAVDPAQQKHGFGRALIAAAESRAIDAGCTVMDIKVVDLRTDLLRFYDRLGYLVTGTEPYEHRPVLQPCHFVTMEKAL
jgi:GNAT superfamily N-acetyltransferase